MIKENDATGLQTFVDENGLRGIGPIFFEFEEPEVLQQAEERKVEVSINNPLVLSIKSRSMECLKFLLSRYNLRSFVEEVEILEKLPGGGECPFR